MKNSFIILILIEIMIGKSLAQQKTTTPPQNTKTQQKIQTQKDAKTQTDPKKQTNKKEINPSIENCNPTAYIRDIVEALKNSGYKFLRSYKLEGSSNAPIQQEYTLSKGTNYLVRAESYVGSNLKMTLYDPTGRVIASSYDPDTQKFYSSIEITCTKTGVYKILFEHHFNKRDFCGGAVLSFKR